MTDRELLELAAKAAGIVPHHWTDSGVPVLNDGIDSWIVVWNPLTDPGDALRLAQKLCFVVDLDEHDVWHGHRKLCEGNPIPNDPLAATMRAIVRAAAEIGKWIR